MAAQSRGHSGSPGQCPLWSRPVGSEQVVRAEGPSALSPLVSLAPQILCCSDIETDLHLLGAICRSSWERGHPLWSQRHCARSVSRLSAIHLQLLSHSAGQVGSGLGPTLCSSGEGGSSIPAGGMSPGSKGRTGLGRPQEATQRVPGWAVGGTQAGSWGSSEQRPGQMARPGWVSHTC